ncbi:MAG: 16S rRNA (cytosine(1402)-N(4))-methyltransferase RsmH [Candidatus Omnitrophica bacterium]|nr:16S rRNA (cytosine(1402)-N(4))-methyltransferase RsmH [Candidatus Omnitrophota bacterium]
MATGAAVHVPVLVEEVLRELSLEAGEVVLDATVGLGGHAEMMLRKIGPRGRLVGLDRDAEALERAGIRLKPFEAQVKLLRGRFGELGRALDQAGVASLDAALFDLGVSSDQLESPERGFSFLREGPLDMRMDPEDSLTAAELVNHASQEELARLLIDFGQERWARRIARAIVRARPLSTTLQLAQAVEGAFPPAARREKIHPATRTFQAIRIAVNDELNELSLGLSQAMERLGSQGRMAVLAYHSLEDRIVKSAFRGWEKEGRFKVLTSKPVRPSSAEIAGNPRARSARLRAGEKTA